MRSFAVWLALPFVCAAARADDTPAPVTLPAMLTLDAALRLFRARGLELLIADAQVQGAHADVLAARSVPNPQLGFTVGKSFTYDPKLACGASAGCSDVVFSVSISDQSALMDTASGRRRLRIAIAEAALSVAHLGRADAQRTLEFQVKQQYLQAMLARDTLDFSVEVQSGMQKMLDLMQLRYKTGAVAETDVDKIETAKLEADQDVDRAAQDLRTAKVGLAFLLGVRGLVPDFAIEPDLPRYVVPASLAGASPGELLDRAIALRPDLKAIREQRRRADLSLAAARRQLVPDVSLALEFGGEGTGQLAVSPPTVTFGLTLTPPLFYRYQGEIARAQAERRTQSLEVARLEAQVVGDVEAAWADFSGTRRRVERMESRLLERARRTRDLMLIQYQKGAASLLEYLDAQRIFISTNFEYLKDLAEFWGAVYQLERVVGMELR